MLLSQLQRFELKRNRFILESLVTKDFKLKYRRSVLGIVWSVLNPLLMMVVLSAVFSNVLRFNGGIENYPLYLILGTVMFSFLQNSSTQAMWSIINAAPLIKKIRVEKLLFPLEKCLFELLNFAFSLIAVVLVMLFFQVSPSLNILWLPLLLCYLLLFCSGIGMLLGALAVFFRDIIHLWSVIITAWTYATPIFYPYSILPDWMQTVMLFNPMYHYISYFRDIVMWNTTPSLTQNLICLGFALVSCFFGLWVFRKTQSKFILYV